MNYIFFYENTCWMFVCHHILAVQYETSSSDRNVISIDDDVAEKLFYVCRIGDFSILLSHLKFADH